jgi:hypothetical protein
VRVNRAALTQLSIQELARIVGLRVRPDAQAEAIVDDVREQVLWVARAGGWVDPTLFEQEVTAAAQRLIPPQDAYRLTEFSLIAAAMPYLDVSTSGSCWVELMRAIAVALRLAYEQAIRALVEWARQPVPMAGLVAAGSGLAPAG